MPSTVRQARFAPVPATVSRLPYDDESYVMKAFSRHVSHCDECLLPSVLCAKGYARAMDVTQYMLPSNGRSYSIIDLDDNQRVQVEIPAGCEQVRGLLKAVERGSLRQKTSPSSSPKPAKTRAPVSYDENYYVGPRQTPSRQRDLGEELDASDAEYQTYERRPRIGQQPRFEKIQPLSRSTTVYRPLSSARRGQSTYYTVGSRGKLPVPGKNDWF